MRLLYPKPKHFDCSSPFAAPRTRKGLPRTLSRDSPELDLAQCWTATSRSGKVWQ